MFRRNWDIIIGFMGLGLLFGSPLLNFLPIETFNGIISLGVLLMIISTVGVLFRIKKRHSRLGLKRELASHIGITICSKCGTRTKMKYTEPFDPSNIDYLEGHTICPKCGHKENWKEGE